MPHSVLTTTTKGHPSLLVCWSVRGTFLTIPGPSPKLQSQSDSHLRQPWDIISLNAICNSWVYGGTSLYKSTTSLAPSDCLQRGASSYAFTINPPFCRPIQDWGTLVENKRNTAIVCWLKPRSTSKFCWMQLNETLTENAI